MLHLTMRSLDTKRAVALLRRGGVLVVPTDTAYALAADPRDTVAIKRIFKIKRRSPEKSLPWVAGSLTQVRRHFQLSAGELRIARRFWPGPLSLVLRPRYRGVSVAVRVPGLPALRSLCLAYGHPLTATSANRSGRANSYAPASVRRQLAHGPWQPDGIIAAGRLRRRRPSTIIKLNRSGLTLLRPGPISENQVKAYV